MGGVSFSVPSAVMCVWQVLLGASVMPEVTLQQQNTATEAWCCSLYYFLLSSTCNFFFFGFVSLSWCCRKMQLLRTDERAALKKTLGDTNTNK